MQVWLDVSKLVALIVEAAGVLLLFREVWRGHAADGHEDFEQVESIEHLVQAGKWQNVYAEFYDYRDPMQTSFVAAQAFATQIGTTACQQALQSAWLTSCLAAEARNRTKSRLRARAEHAIGLIKRVFGFQKVCYRGLVKNLQRLEVTCALANPFMVRRRLLRLAD